MRISDCSSDVCSSDLPFARPISVQTWGPHRSVSTYGNPDYAPPERAKVERLAYANIATGNVVSAGSLDIMDILVRHPAINPTKSKHWALDVTRSEERRVGKECFSTCRSRWSPYH